MPPVGSEPNISAGERLQTYALDRAATGTGWLLVYHILYKTNIGTILLSEFMYLTIVNEISSPTRYADYVIHYSVSLVQPDDGQGMAETCS